MVETSLQTLGVLGLCEHMLACVYQNDQLYFDAFCVQQSSHWNPHKVLTCSPTVWASFKHSSPLKQSEPEKTLPWLGSEISLGVGAHPTPGILERDSVTQWLLHLQQIPSGFSIGYSRKMWTQAIRLNHSDLGKGKFETARQPKMFDRHCFASTQTALSKLKPGHMQNKVISLYIKDMRHDKTMQYIDSAPLPWTKERLSSLCNVDDAAVVAIMMQN